MTQILRVFSTIHRLCAEVQRFRGAEVQRFRGSGFRGSEVQRFRGSEVQRFRGSSKLGLLNVAGPSRSCKALTQAKQIENNHKS